MGNSLIVTTKRHLLVQKHVIWCIDHQLVLVTRWRIKHQKGISRNCNTWQVTCSPRPPTLSQRHMDLHVWSYPRRSYIFQVSSKSIQGFRSPWGSNLPIPITLAIGFYNQLALPCKPWYNCRSTMKQFVTFYSSLCNIFDNSCFKATIYQFKCVKLTLHSRRATTFSWLHPLWDSS